MPKHLTDVFCENGHDRKTLQKTMNSFEKKTRGTNNNDNKNNTNKQQTVTFPWTAKIGSKIEKTK